ncbi:MAG: TolC family protein [Gemmatimonadetes bacterium]|nr:TolC family protein [Gemmatimonadota bacterium]
MRSMGGWILAALLASLWGGPLAAQDPEASEQTRGVRAPGDSLQLTLEQAVARAQDTSEEVRLARAQVDLAGAQVRNVRSTALPQINGSFGYTRTFQSQFSGGGDVEIADSLKFEPDSLGSVADRLRYLEKHAATAGLGWFGNLPFGRVNAYSVNLSGSQTLYSGGRVGSALKAAGLYREAADLQLEEQQADIELSVRSAYYRALLAGELERIAEAAVAQADAFLAQERIRERSGSASELDVMRAEVGASNLRTQAIQAANSADLALLDLRRLVNLPADRPVKLTTALEVPATARLSAPAADSTDLANRAAVSAAERQVHMRELGVKIARGGYLPSASLRVNYGRFLYPNQPFSWGGNSWASDLSASLTVDLPIFNGLRREAEIDQARVEQVQALLQLAQLKEAVSLQYEQASGEQRRAAAAILARQQTVAQAQLVYDLTVLRYDLGLATQLEVSDARLALLQASTNLALALSDFYIAEATVRRALGRSGI